MLELLRKHQHGIMIVVAFLVIIAFAWFFNPYDNRQGSLNQAVGYTMGSKAVTVKEIQRQQRLVGVAQQLGFNFVYQIMQPTFDGLSFSQNRLLIAEKARELGIDPSEKEVNEAIAQHPQFQRDGKFSEDAYMDAITNTLEPASLVPEDLRNLVADKLRWEGVTALLSSGAVVPDSVVDVEFQREEEAITASVVDFKLADYEEGVDVTDDELQKFYDEQKALVPTLEQQAKGQLTPEQQEALELMMSDEQRKVQFVFIAEPAAPAPPPPVQPGLTPPPLLQPGAGSSAPTGLSAPPIEPIEITPVGEEEPPGQAPLEEGGTALEVEPLPEAPELEVGELDLAAPEDLNTEVNVGGLGDGAGAAPEINLGGDAPAMNLDAPALQLDAPDLGDAAPEINFQPQNNAGGNAAVDSDHAEKVKEYKKQVGNFYDTVQQDPEQFASLAQAEGFELKSTELFTQESPPASPLIPAELLNEIFNGTIETDKGLLVPVQGVSPKGFYVARLLEVVDASERSFEDAKEDLREKLIEKKAKEKLADAVKAAKEKLAAALESGKSFADAAKEQELVVRDLGEFTSKKRPTGENVTEILAEVPKVTTGSVSDMVEAGDNALLVYVSQRVAASEEKAPDAAPVQPGQPAPVDPVVAKKVTCRSS